MKAADSNRSTKPTLLYAIFLVALVFIIYGQSISFDFISDDLFYLNENYLIRHPANVWKLIDVPENGGMGEMPSGFLKGRNFRDLSYALDYWIWGEQPSGFHLTNILLHLVAGFLLYRFGRLFLSRRAAYIGTAIFLLHPVNSEVVAYISGRKEALMSIAVLACLLLLERSRKPGGAWLYPFVFVAFAVAFFVKEAAITLIGLILLKDIVLNDLSRDNHATKLLNKRRIVEWAGLGTLALVLFFNRFDLGVLGLETPSNIPSEQPATSGPMGPSPGFLIPFYALRFFYPVNLQFEYRGGFSDDWSWLVNAPILQGGAVVAIVSFIIFLVFKQRALAYCLLWFYVALFPVLHFVPFHTPAAEHYLYLPGMGLSLFSGFLLSKAASTSPKLDKLLAATVTGITFLVLSVMTFFRVQDYKNDYTLFQDAYLKNTKNMNAYYGMSLGGVRSGDIRPEDGIKTFEQFRWRRPEIASFYFILGHLYETTDQPGRAKSYYETAIKYGHKPWEVYIALARIEIKEDRLNQARDLLLRLLDNYPYHPKAYILLGAITMMANDPSLALEYFKQAKGIDLHSAKADIGIDFAMWQLGLMSKQELLRLHSEALELKEGQDAVVQQALLTYLLKKPEKPGTLEILDK